VKLAARDIERLLDSWPVGRLATISTGGRPHQVPVVFARHAGSLYTPVDGKPKRGGELVRVRNSAEESSRKLPSRRVLGRLAQLWWLRVEAQIEVIEPAAGRPGDPSDADDVVAGAVAALRGKYPQYQTIAVLRDPPTFPPLGASRADCHHC
jgi:PPOX class probable F420-dependent enzyme